MGREKSTLSADTIAASLQRALTTMAQRVAAVDGRIYGDGRLKAVIDSLAEGAFNA